jgi:hypothetical protein
MSGNRPGRIDHFLLQAADVARSRLFTRRCSRRPGFPPLTPMGTQSTSPVRSTLRFGSCPDREPTTASFRSHFQRQAAMSFASSGMRRVCTRSRNPAPTTSAYPEDEGAPHCLEIDPIFQTPPLDERFARTGRSKLFTELCGYSSGARNRVVPTRSGRGRRVKRAPDGSGRP